MSREFDIQSIRSRPRFKLKTRLSREEFTHRLSRQFEVQKRVLGGYVGKEISIIRLRKDKKKYWAPQLQIRSEKDEENPEITIVRGLLGPRPTVWTFFMFLYIFGGTTFIFFGMIWIVQANLNITSGLVIWAWVGLAILIFTWLASLIGQRIAKQHISILREFMEKVVNDELEENFE
ncbi:MAG: hypothetical protein Q4G27_03005 [Flavobacteriaceae bacterium]|nr:hypothetical protein [Flavobacteriaceae bacterium]